MYVLYGSSEDNVTNLYNRDVIVNTYDYVLNLWYKDYTSTYLWQIKTE